MARWSRLARWRQTLSLLCALMCLPIATTHWSMSAAGSDHAPSKSWTARHCSLGALFGRGGGDLREMLRCGERSRAGFSSVSSRAARISALRAAHRRAAAARRLVVPRRSLRRSASGRSGDDPPA